MTEREASSFVGHEPCPDCGSSDGLSRYDDGHGYCHAGCPDEVKYKRPDGEASVSASKPSKDARGFPVSGEAKRLDKRNLSEETCRKWGYFQGTYNTRPVQIANYIRDGVIVAQKVRFPGKEFTFLGKPKDAGLYGMHLWRDGGRMLVITEGEIDALSVSQLQDNKWPVVSVPNGASGAKKDLAKCIDWLEQFESVILMFDNDEAGNKAVAECAPLFSPGKCKVARLPMKDANEMLVAGRGKEVIDAIWGAKVYRPDGILSAADIVEDALAEPVMGLPWLYETMTKWTNGRRPGEIYGFGAGTGVGKTDLFTGQIDYDIRVLELTAGVIYLEQPCRETVTRVAGKSVGKVLHVPGDYTPEEREAAIRAVGALNRLFLYEHFGAMDWDTIKQRIRYMAVALGCKVIYLDHLTALVADEEDERKALDTIMAQLASLGQELGVIIHFISHLSTPEGKPHEEGGRVMLRHFRGSRSIGMWAHFAFGLERNQQADDLDVRCTTTLRCLKDRVTGRATGNTIGLKYDQATGLSHECEPPGEFKDETKGGDF